MIKNLVKTFKVCNAQWCLTSYTWAQHKINKRLYLNLWTGQFHVYPKIFVSDHPFTSIARWCKCDNLNEFLYRKRRTQTWRQEMKDGKQTSRERSLQNRQSCLWAVRASEILFVKQCSPLPTSSCITSRIGRISSSSVRHCYQRWICVIAILWMCGLHELEIDVNTPYINEEDSWSVMWPKAISHLHWATSLFVSHILVWDLFLLF